jgi:hypothetical protein
MTSLVGVGTQAVHPPLVDVPILAVLVPRGAMMSPARERLMMGAQGAPTMGVEQPPGSGGPAAVTTQVVLLPVEVESSTLERTKDRRLEGGAHTAPVVGVA